jgi:hypothetical protein
MASSLTFLANRFMELELERSLFLIEVFIFFRLKENYPYNNHQKEETLCGDSLRFPASNLATQRVPDFFFILFYYFSE